MLFILFLININIIFNKKPVIGIYGIPNVSNFQNSFYNTSIIDGALIRYVEDMGGSPLLIPQWLNFSEIEDILYKINGVIFPGLAKNISTKGPWEDNINFILKFSMKNKLPVYGICRGFLMINGILSNSDEKFYDNYNHKGNDLVIFNKKTRKSRLFSLFDDKNFMEFENYKSTPYWQIYGFNETNFYKNKFLTENFDLILTGYDNKTKKHFVNAIESKKESGFLIYGTQFHPEKVPYIRDFRYRHQHEMDSLKRSQLIIMFFIEECRKNNNFFSEEDKKEKKYYFLNGYHKNVWYKFHHNYTTNYFTYFK